MARDFNIPKDLNEKLGGSFENAKLESMSDLCNLINDTNLIDLELYGSKYMWKNQQKVMAFILCRMDKIIFFESLMCTFLDMFLKIFPQIGSDYNPLYLSLENTKKPRNNPFRSKIMWMSHPDLEPKIKEWWNTIVHGTRIFSLTKKLQYIKKKLKVWNRRSSKMYRCKKENL